MVNDKLNTIAAKSDKFSFKVDCKPMKFTKEETSSFMCDKIIGREEDVEKIIGVLLGSHNVDQPNVSLLAIMGMGGLGKTALAQLVYNDPRICDAFRLKKWTCIADQDEQQWSLKAFLGKVVKGPSIDDKSSLEEIHFEVKGQLEGKKYLLVLDDVWTESYEQWQQVEGFLKVGGKGSWIIVTTRSKTTAQMIGGDQVHVLQGLSEPESWLLFERMTFQTGERDDELVKLGKEIVKKCTNVPLAIRVVGSLLRGQSKSKWLSFHDKGLDYLSESTDTMTRILKLSYDQLNPSLKTCFAYCAIFPKDCEISKQTLVQLWMAQGYINSENLGEEYFLILLQRCFFQDLPEDEFEGNDSFKIHDLLHDLAEKVAGEEICRFSFDTCNVGKRVRHLSFVSNSYAQLIIKNSHIRTRLQLEGHLVDCTVEQLLASKSIPKWIWLRSLDLSFSKAKSLPKSIGQLLHLRNLDLSFSRQLEFLPKSITKLVNLQTLLLDSCSQLKQLPNDVSKLVDLSTLNVAGCHALSHMPVGIGMLTCLQTLCQFVVGAPASSTLDQCFNGLQDLQHLNRLKGSLTIEIAVLENAKFVKEEQGGGGYLRSKEHLEMIAINFRHGDEYGSKESEQALLEEMQPHPNVKTLMMFGYHGETIPRWPRKGDNSALFDLPNLVTLEIQNCIWLLYLPWQVGKLPHLKTLDISDLWNMVYLMDADSETFISGEESSFFPSLQNLRINELYSLKGWWRRTESVLQVVNPNDGGSSGEVHLEWVSSPCFPVLKELTIENSEEMNFVPLFPQLEHLEIDAYAGKLLWTNRKSTTHHQLVQLSSSLSYPISNQGYINEFKWQKFMSVKYTRFLSEINIRNDFRCMSLGEAKELLPTPLLSSLRTLHIKNCLYLKSVGGWLKHLSALEILSIDYCPKVALDGMSSWRNLAGTLQYLELAGMYEMEKLPEGMQYCTSLRSLYICYLPSLNSLPKWMPRLTSLQTLKLQRCSKSLFERCQQPNGEDRPLIRHISKVEVTSRE